LKRIKKNINEENFTIDYNDILSFSEELPASTSATALFTGIKGHFIFTARKQLIFLEVSALHRAG
jgi:hypothetical protein